MTPTLGTSPHAHRAGASSLSELQLSTLQAVLVASRARQTAQQAQHAALFAALSNSTDDTTSRDRAIAALRMYCARDAVEQIDNALGRIGEPDYGTCMSAHDAAEHRRDAGRRGVVTSDPRTGIL